MSQHLYFSEGTVRNRSPQGQFNIELLRLNNGESITYRHNVIENTQLIVELVLSKKHLKHKSARSIIDRSVKLLAKLTCRSESRIRKVLQV